MVQQASELSKKPHVVIATPGRLASLMSTDSDFTFKNIKYLVLDEADRLLESSFEEDLKVCMNNVETNFSNNLSSMYRFFFSIYIVWMLPSSDIIIFVMYLCVSCALLYHLSYPVHVGTAFSVRLSEC